MDRAQAINWLLDLDFADIDTEELLDTLVNMSDAALASEIELLYDGGLYQFTQDGR